VREGGKNAFVKDVQKSLGRIDKEKKKGKR